MIDPISPQVDGLLSTSTKRTSLPESWVPHLGSPSVSATRSAPRPQTATQTSSDAVTEDTVSISPEATQALSAHSVTPAATAAADSGYSGYLFPPLYTQLQPDGTPDFNSAHTVANTMYANDYYSDPQHFDAAAEQAKYKNMSDNQLMSAYMETETAFLASQFDAAGKALPAPPGGNTDPSTGKPFNAEKA
ncbi:MAG: hypothetical protein U0Q18_09655 [Bryobacteraceae bacterium]